MLAAVAALAARPNGTTSRDRPNWSQPFPMPSGDELRKAYRDLYLSENGDEQTEEAASATRTSCPDPGTRHLHRTRRCAANCGSGSTRS